MWQNDFRRGLLILLQLATEANVEVGGSGSSSIFSIHLYSEDIAFTLKGRKNSNCAIARSFFTKVLLKIP